MLSLVLNFTTTVTDFCRWSVSLDIMILSIRFHPRRLTSLSLSVIVLPRAVSIVRRTVSMSVTGPVAVS